MSSTQLPKYASYYVWNRCKKHFRLYLIVGACAIILALLVTSFIPVRYASQATLVDEHKELGLLVGLNNSTAWIVQNKANLTEDQGINNPEVYGMIIESRDFHKKLLLMPLSKAHQQLGDYLKSLRIPWWKITADRIERFFSNDYSEEERLLDMVQEHLRYSYSFKKGTIVIQYEDQNPEVCFEVVSTVVKNLQGCILEQRNKVYQEQIKGIRENIKRTRNVYLEALAAYTQYANAHQGDAIMTQEKKMEALEKERDLTFDDYKNTCLQLRRQEFIAMQKVQSFSILKQASVPLTPIAPSIPVYIITFLIIGCVFTTWYLLYLKE